MVTLANRAKVGTTTTGTGTITLGSAESGYQTFADAGVADGDVVRYVIEDGTDWEIGSGTYTASGTTLSRTVLESSNADAALNLSGSAVVYVSAAAEDIPSPTLAIDTKTGAYTVVSGDLGKIIEFTGTGAVTASLTSASTLGAGWYAYIRSNKTTGSATIDPDGSETIEGATTLSVKRGQTVKIVSDGTNWLVTESDFPRGFSYDNANNATAANASGSGAVAIGYGATASGGYNFAAGASSAGAGASAGTGGGAVSLGGSYASGTDSFAAAITNNTSSYGATGSNSVAMGYRSKGSSGKSTAIGGEQPLASGSNSFAAGGEFQTASGAYSVSLGGSVNTASGEAAYAFGKRALADKVGKYAYGAQLTGTSGATQAGMMVLVADTTDATPEALRSNTNAAGATNQIILPNNSAYAFHGTIVARQDAASGTACAAWKIEGLIRREGSAGTTVLVNSATTVLDNTPAWGMALSADTTNGGLKIEVAGAAATNIRWVATVNTSEVTY